MLRSKEESLLEVKAERNSYRSKASSMTKELLQSETANQKRLDLIAELKQQLASQRGEIQVC